MTRTRVRRRRSGAWTVVGAGLVSVGIALLTATTVAPEPVAAAWGVVRTGVVSAPQLITGELPHVTLGASGGDQELDRCEGTFTEMIPYRRDGLPPIWAAHNNCGGDVILPWQTGQQFMVDDRTYEVVEVRLVPKHTTTTVDLVGLAGDLGLQTCLYGEQTMVFVGAIQIEGEADSE